MYFLNIPTSFRIIFLSVMIEMDFSKFAVWMWQKRKKTQLRKQNYLQGINRSHLGKGKSSSKSDFWWDMLVPWRVPLLQVIMEVEMTPNEKNILLGGPIFHWIMIVGGRGNLRAGSIWRQVTRSRGPSLSQYAIIFWLWGVLASLSGSTSESPENKLGEILAKPWAVRFRFSTRLCTSQQCVNGVNAGGTRASRSFAAFRRRCIWPFTRTECLKVWRSMYTPLQAMTLQRALMTFAKRWLGISWRLTFVQPWWLEVWSAWPKVLGVIIWAKTRICNVDVPP